jgi:hypothetical protein
MNRYKLAIALLFSLFSVIAQNDSIKVEKKIVRFTEYFRVGIIKPISLGNNTYSEDIKSKFGINSSLSIISIYDFNLGAGADISWYSIEKPENIGTFSNAKTLAYHFEINRVIKLNTSFNLIPYIGIGQTNFILRERNVKRLNKNGNLYRIGFLNSYKLDNTANIYLGLEYNTTKFNIQTIPELVDYYNQNNQFVVSFGFLMN